MRLYVRLIQKERGPNFIHVLRPWDCLFPQISQAHAIQRRHLL